MSRKSRIEGALLPRIDVTREEDFAEWYKQVLLNGDMMDYHDLPGCFILKPTACFIWEEIRRWFDIQMRRLGVKNCSIPLFVSQETIQKNEGRLDEKLSKLPWITQIGEVPLERKIAVHAPSELVLYPSYAKWINSHRDLPLKLNQWHSVAQWEMKKDIPPLLQADEFLWQEAHTAHLTSQSAYDELEEITGLYAYIFEDLLAVPVTKGWNTQKGKSAGTLYTSSVEVYIPDAGYSIQGASCNGLGHNYSKIFGIAVEDPEKKSVGAESEKHLLHVWQNSWSLSSRAIGIMVMSHADERGIILPPRVAEIQAIIIPVGLGGLNHDERKKLHDEIRTLSSLLSSEGVRAESDIREGYSPGWKFNEWDLRGVPLRLHFGPEESAGDFVTAARRDIAGDDAKSTVLISNLTTGVLTLLYEIHNNLYSRVESKVRSQQRLVRTWPDFLPSIIEGKVCLAPHCLTEKCEHELENRVSLEAENQCRETKHASTTATTFKGLCVPFDQPEGIERGVTKCINPDCEQPAEKWCMFGFSY